MKYIIKYLFVLALLVFTVSQIVAQNVAKVGNKYISSTEFKKRYEFTPRVKDSESQDSARINFLYTLIAEKLWAQKAEKIHLDTSEYVRTSVYDVEKKLVIDKLYKEEIENKIIISDAEINKDRLKLNRKYLMNFILSKSKLEIDKIYNQLKKGVKFDSILVNRSEFSQQKDDIIVEYGQMSKELEDIIFSMKKNDFSKPINSNVGWTIYYVRDILPSNEQYKPDAEIKKVKDMIFARKAQVLYKKFFNDNILNTKVGADNKLFSVLSEAIFTVLENEDSLAFNKYKNEFELDFYSTQKVRARISDKDKNRIFIKFKDNPIPLDQFLRELELNVFGTKTKNLNDIQRSLNARIKKYIFNELLAREGYSRNYQNSGEIKKELSLWKDSFMASYYINSIIDSIHITQEELKDFYRQMKEKNELDSLISFEQISTLFSNDAINVYNSLGSSSSLKNWFDSLDSARKNKFRYDSFNKISSDSKNLIISEANKLRVGEVYGPIKYSGAYHIIRLIDKVSNSKLKNKSFDQMKEQLKRYLFNKRYTELLENKTVELAEDFQIQINREVLNKLKLTSIEMLVFRNLGFGLQMNAVPYSQSFYNWKNWLPKKVIKKLP